MTNQHLDVLFVEFGALGGVAESTATLAVELERRGRSVGVLSVRPSSTSLFRWPVHLYEPSAFARLVTAPPEYRRAGGARARRAIAAGRVLLLSIVFVRRLHALAPNAGLVSIQGRLFSPLVLALTLTARRADAVVAVTPHNLFSRWNGIVGALDNAVMRHAVDRANAVVLHGPLAESSSSRSPTLRGLSVPSLSGPNPIPVHALTRKGSPRESDRSRPVLLTPGYIRRDKGVEAFARALAATNLDAEYHVVGVPRDRGVVREIEAIADPRVRVSALRRPLGSEEFADLLLSCDLVVLPYEAATGSGVLESCVALSVPVASAPFAAARELEATGAAVITAASSDPAEIVDATRRWLELPPDERDRRAELGAAGLRDRLDAALEPYEMLIERRLD